MSSHQRTLASVEGLPKAHMASRRAAHVVIDIRSPAELGSAIIRLKRLVREVGLVAAMHRHEHARSPGQRSSSGLGSALVIHRPAIDS